MAPTGPLRDIDLVGEAQVVREKVGRTRTRHGRKDAAVIGAAVVAVAGEEGCTR